MSEVLSEHELEGIVDSIQNNLTLDEGIDAVRNIAIAHANVVIGRDIKHSDECREYSNTQQIDKFCICLAQQQNILIVEQRQRNVI